MADLGVSWGGERGPQPGGDAEALDAADPRVGALAGELIEASGNFGLRVDKLVKASTLLGLAAVHEVAEREGLTVPEAALHHVRQTVDGWPDKRGRAILRAALGFDRGTERGRLNRLSLLAADFTTSPTTVENATGESLDTTFTTRLADDLAAELLVGERRRTSKRLRLVLAAILGLLLVGLAAVIVTRSGGADQPRSALVFKPVPQRCSIEVCNSEQGAIAAQTGGFTPNGRVRVEIFAPGGENANDLGGVYAYRDELIVDDNGEFTWRYWWDPGMEIGVYSVRITDMTTGEHVETGFEFLRRGRQSADESPNR